MEAIDIKKLGNQFARLITKYQGLTEDEKSYMVTVAMYQLFNEEIDAAQNLADTMDTMVDNRRRVNLRVMPEPGDPRVYQGLYCAARYQGDVAHWLQKKFEALKVQRPEWCFDTDGEWMEATND